MKRILIIDDDEQVRLMLRMTLETEGYSIVEAADGIEGMKRFRENPFPVVITDLIMPEKEGIEFIQDLKRDYPDCVIIAISGGGRSDARGFLRIAEALGANFTFDKPIERKELMETLEQIHF